MPANRPQPAPYRVLVSDLDGTLLDRRQRISPANREAVARLVARGYIFTLATGRAEASVRTFVEELGLRHPLILYNGARVVDAGLRRPSLDRRLSQAAARRAVALFAELGASPIVYCPGAAYVEAFNGVLRRYIEKDHLPLQAAPLAELLAPGREPPLKVLAIGDEEVFAEFRKRYRAPDGSTPVVVQSEPDYLEVLPPGVSKGAALGHLARLLGVTPAEVVAVGDGPNDLEMLQAAGAGVAVANAHPSVLAGAGWVTAHHEEDAIARVVERFFPEAA